MPLSPDDPSRPTRGYRTFRDAVDDFKRRHNDRLATHRAPTPKRSVAATNPPDFVKHYYFGEGRPVGLGEVGLGADFEMAPSVKGATEKFMSDVMKEAAEGYAATDVKDRDVTWEPRLFSLGDGRVRMNAICGPSTCTFHFETKDSFRDVFGMGVGAGGTPYPIQHAWTVTKAYR